MPNPGQPTIGSGSTDATAVRRLQRALRRSLPDLGLQVDGIFGPKTEADVREFQQRALVVDGIVGPQTWAALPDGGPMPTLEEGSAGEVVTRLQTVLTELTGATTPGAIDGIFGPQTKASVEAFQRRHNVRVDGIVGDQTWGTSLAALSASLETEVGLQFVIG